MASGGKGSKSDTTADADLWQKMANTVTRKASSRAHPQDEQLRQTPLKAPVKKGGRTIQALKSPAIGIKPHAATAAKAVLAPADLRIGQRAGIDNASSRRLTQGRFEIDQRLDLHGMTQMAAHARLRQFIQNAAIQGHRTVLIITGKGAAGQGVLRQKVPEWLKEPPLAGLVMAIAQASGKDGGGGALYVRLRRDRDAGL